MGCGHQSRSSTSLVLSMTADDWYCLRWICVGVLKNTCLAWVQNHVGRKTISSFLMKGCTLLFWFLTQRSKTIHSPVSDCFPLLVALQRAFCCVLLFKPLIALTSPVSRFPAHLIVLAPPSLINAALSSQSYSDACWCFWMCVSVFWSNGPQCSQLRVWLSF